MPVIIPSNKKPFGSLKHLLLFTCLMLVVAKLHAQDIQKINFKKPIKFSGNVNLQFQYYHANGISPREKEFSWLINGNPMLTVLGIQVPFSFVLSNFENKFYQPFNQFGISPYYKWIKLHLGYQNITYSHYTLAGHLMLGAGFDLTPKKFRIGFMYGQLKKINFYRFQHECQSAVYKTYTYF